MLTTSVVVIPPPPADITESEAVHKRINPAGAYLESLGSKKSRRDLGYALTKFASTFFHIFDEDSGLWKFGGPDAGNSRSAATWETTDWTQLRQEHIRLAPKWVRDAGYHQSTVNQYVNVLKMVVAHCFDLGKVDAGVEMRARRVKTNKPVDQRRHRALRREEMVRLFAALEEESNPYRKARDYATLALMAWAGLRMVDTQNLTLEDVLEEGRTLIVHRKGAKVQRLGVNPLVTKYLLPWLRVRGSEPGPVICRIGKGSIVKAEKGISKTSYAKLVQRYADLAAIGDVTPHDLRATFAVRLRALGTPIEEIAELMGHSNINTTRIYLANLEQESEATIRNIDLMKETP